MRNYLDPVYLAVTEEAWRDRIYSDIFGSLNTILAYLEDIEKKDAPEFSTVK